MEKKSEKKKELQKKKSIFAGQEDTFYKSIFFNYFYFDQLIARGIRYQPPIHNIGILDAA